MKKLNLTFKFLLPIFAVFILIAAALSYQASSSVKRMVMNQTVDLVVEFIKFNTARHIASGSDFSLADPLRTEQVFQKVSSEVKTGDVMRIKVWDKAGTVIFSDDKSIAGKNFSDNREFQEAIKGEVEVEIKEPIKAENASEKGYHQLMEVYVPITLAGQTNPVGVVETYYNMDALNNNIRKVQIQMTLINLGAFLVLAIIISILFHALVVKPLKGLEAGMAEIREKGI